MSTMEIWYQGAWSRRENTSEGFARLKDSKWIGEAGREIWERASPDNPVVVAIVGDPEAELPDCHIVMNTENHSFSVQEYRSEAMSLHSATFMELSQWRGVEGSYHRDIPQEQADRRKGQLMLYHLNGQIAGHEDPAYSTRLSISFDATVQSTTLPVGAPKESVLIDYAPWPGIENDDDWLWVPYPEFNSYHALIARAREAFDFFLEERDPRISWDPIDSEETSHHSCGATDHIDAPRPRTKYSAELSFRAERSTAATAEERVLFDQILEKMPVRGEGFAFFGPVGDPPTILEGTSRLWDIEPIEEIVDDLHTKLNGLTLMRHVFKGSTWRVSLADMEVPWNTELGRFDPPN